MTRIWSWTVGVGFVVVGVMRFMALPGLPGWETREPVHGVLHLVTGALWLAAAALRHGCHAGLATRWLGAFWLAVGVAGEAGWLDGVEALAFDDAVVHLVVGLGAVVVGWAPVGKRSPT
ncbi:hypothetical protein ETD86_41365 [Nonomuraea turkmeniaca]|uniref:DUF4383 domain-containing protein n=1 Tax=Nonomuraea turkmeniaca TaxID=103838 RepID=A0A5S4F1L2_9ACTN|nr:hypothetical protein [Nonomuraea turkmeniaca]TMR09970.1 hypothetical protein ETD86_41365 [Nonomuraea turkmeniaca]